MSISGFSVTVDQNPYLPAGGRDVNAIVTVTADDTGNASWAVPPGGNAEVIILDCSASMDHPPAKLTEARAATSAALEVIRDGTWFAVIAGGSTASPVYPADGSMAVASERTRAEARAALRQLRAHGGTAIGQWLRLARRLLSASPATLRHAILLTDGKNEHERPEDLAAAVDECAGVFQCDCRGIGTDWDVAELRRIAAALDGSLDIVVNVADLATQFADLMRESMRKRQPDVRLRVWTPQTARVKFIRQVAPAIDDLTGRRQATDAGAQVGVYPTGAWAPGESRDYHVAITVNPAYPGQQMLAARIDVLADQDGVQQVLGRGEMLATWTDDEARSKRMNLHVAGYTGQAELAAAIAEGLDAVRRGDEESAAARLGQAVALARAAGNEEIARLLATLVDVVDETSGSVRLKRRTDADAEMSLDTHSTKTVRVEKAPAGARPQPAGPRPGSVPSGPAAQPPLPPPPPPPSPQGSPAPATVAGPETAVAPAERYLLAQMPARVPVSAEVSLVVRISADPRAVPATRSAALAGLTVSPTGTAVTVVVQAPSDLAARSPLQQVITVPPAGDPPPVRFEFLAREAGLQRLMVTAWAGGTFLAELGLELSVDDGGRYVDAPVRVAPAGSVKARDGEVTLQVRFDGQRYTFQLLSEPYLFEPVPAEELTAHPTAAVERTVAMLRSIAEGTSGYSARNARAWMQQAGVGLWNDMVPQLIKEQFWQLREHIGTFSIVAGGDVIPWELLYPMSPKDDEGFLVEQFPVMRRVYGQHRARSLTVAGARYVLPARSPANAQAEIAAIRHVLGGDSEAADTFADLDALLGFIESGSCGSLHFACHNAFTSDDGGSAITMGGGSFVPMLLNKAVTRQLLAERNPLIFINACRSAGAVPEYTRMTGWAQQFMAAGAGAFVGTLWAVGSTAAQVFAENFYGALASGEPLGEASRRARVAAARDADDPTWLAYSVYGDPAAQAVRPS